MSITRSGLTCMLFIVYQCPKLDLPPCAAVLASHRQIRMTCSVHIIRTPRGGVQEEETTHCKSTPVCRSLIKDLLIEQAPNPKSSSRNPTRPQPSPEALNLRFRVQALWPLSCLAHNPPPGIVSTEGCVTM